MSCNWEQSGFSGSNQTNSLSMGGNFTKLAQNATTENIKLINYFEGLPSSVPPYNPTEKTLININYNLFSKYFI